MFRQIDQSILLIAILMLIYTFVLIYAEHMFKNDAQIFQVVSNIISGLGGALLRGITGDKPKSELEGKG